MCAGISFYLNKVTQKELERYLLTDEVQKFSKLGLVETYFWQEKPFLPVEEDDGVHLYEWGNREKFSKLPKTGWARIESLQDGKWDYLAPKVVNVPAYLGYEKKKWFKTPEGLKAVKVRLHNVVRVYLITKKASLLFEEYTGHDRMPVGKIVYLK